MRSHYANVLHHAPRSCTRGFIRHHVLSAILLIASVIFTSNAKAATANPRDPRACMPPCCVAKDTPSGRIIVGYRCYPDRDICKLEYQIACRASHDNSSTTPMPCAEDIVQSDVFCKLGTYMNDGGCSPAVQLSTACEAATISTQAVKEQECMLLCQATCAGGTIDCVIRLIVR